MVATVAAWSVFVLGIVHTVFGLVRFRRPFAEAVSEGFVNRFRTGDRATNNQRGDAFWFTIFGPLLALAGQLALGAADRGEVETLTILGAYLLATSVVGVMALPKSGFWATLILAIVLLGVGWGWWT